jgi:hypothetical protein
LLSISWVPQSKGKGKTGKVPEQNLLKNLCVLSSDERPSSPSEETAPTVVEKRKRRTKKVVDYVFSMESAYGSLTPLLRRVTIRDDRDDGLQRLFTPRDSIRGFTGILRWGLGSGG